MLSLRILPARSKKPHRSSHRRSKGFIAVSEPVALGEGVDEVWPQECADLGAAEVIEAADRPREVMETPIGPEVPPVDGDEGRVSVGQGLRELPAAESVRVWRIASRISSMRARSGCDSVGSSISGAKTFTNQPAKFRTLASGVTTPGTSRQSTAARRRRKSLILSVTQIARRRSSAHNSVQDRDSVLGITVNGVGADRSEAVANSTSGNSSSPSECSTGKASSSRRTHHMPSRSTLTIRDSRPGRRQLEHIGFIRRDPAVIPLPPAEQLGRDPAEQYLLVAGRTPPS